MISFLNRRPQDEATRLGVDLLHVPVGITDSGETWTLPLLGNCLLLAGLQGSGKSSLLWSIIRGVAPAIKAGIVEVHAIDPKGGMELTIGADLFEKFVPGTPFTAVAGMLKQDVEEMQARLVRHAGQVRVVQPTKAEPLILIIIDEIASLTAYLPDKELKASIASSIYLLTSQGRAAGVTVIGAVQDPGLDVVPMRKLFGTKVGFRLDTPEQVRQVLGEGARDQGAYCDKIPPEQPGVAYVRLEKVREPVRVRAAYVTDGDIRDMAQRFGKPRNPGAVKMKAILEGKEAA